MSLPTYICLYDADCGVCGLCVRLGRRLDRWGRIEFISSQDTARWPTGVDAQLLTQTIVVAGEGRQWTRAAAVARLLALLPWLAPLSWLLRAPGVSWLAERAYRVVSRNRMRISGWLGLGVCGVAERDSTKSGKR